MNTETIFYRLRELMDSMLITFEPLLEVVTNPSQDSLIAMLLILVGVLGLIAYRRFYGRYPYIREPRLLTPVENQFFSTLEHAVPNNVRVAMKVRVADTISPKKHLKNRRFWRAFAPIGQKHFDFVLVNRNDSSILMAIELDDSSHSRKDRVERDRFLDKVCEAAQLPLLRVKAARTYDKSVIQAQINEAYSSM